jgi:hypothetical protein
MILEISPFYLFSNTFYSFAFIMVYITMLGQNNKSTSFKNIRVLYSEEFAVFSLLALTGETQFDFCPVSYLHAHISA